MAHGRCERRKNWGRDSANERGRGGVVVLSFSEQDLPAFGVGRVVLALREHVFRALVSAEVPTGALVSALSGGNWVGGLLEDCEQKSTGQQQMVEWNAEIAGILLTDCEISTECVES